jgi:hypothetical protein
MTDEQARDLERALELASVALAVSHQVLESYGILDMLKFTTAEDPEPTPLRTVMENGLTVVRKYNEKYLTEENPTA